MVGALPLFASGTGAGSAVGALPSSAAGAGEGSAVGALPLSTAGTGVGGVDGALPASMSPLSKEGGVEAISCAAAPGCIVAEWEFGRILPCSAWGLRELPILVGLAGFSSWRTGTGGVGSVALSIGAASDGCASPPPVGDVT